MLASFGNTANEFNWKLAKNGNIDLRNKGNRENMHRLIMRLNEQLDDERKQNRQFKRRVHHQHAAIEKMDPENAAKIDPPDEGCLICCSDVMEGEAKLSCGHKLCTECFARHARVNHTCPFCREPFADKVKKKELIPDDQITHIVHRIFYNSSTAPDYFQKHLERIKQISTEEAVLGHLEWLVIENCKIAGRCVARWYDS